jgi:hypothetical protein
MLLPGDTEVGPTRRKCYDGDNQSKTKYTCTDLRPMPGLSSNIHVANRVEGMHMYRAFLRQTIFVLTIKLF